MNGEGRNHPEPLSVVEDSLLHVVLPVSLPQQAPVEQEDQIQEHKRVVGEGKLSVGSMIVDTAAAVGGVS